MPYQKTYLVDEQLYQREKHTPMLETTEYCCVTETLVQQNVHAPMRKALSEAIPKLKASRFAVTQDYYYSVNPQNQNKRSISKAVFDQRLKEQADRVIETSQETLLENKYTDKTGKPARVVIAITQHNGNPRQAGIEFQDEQQAQAFVAPPWLKETPANILA